MAITGLTQLHSAIADWFEQNIVDSRLQQGDKSREWCTDAMGYTSPLLQAAMRAFIDRSQLNSDYTTKYKATTTAEKKNVVFDKVEISVLYSFLKCFVERHKTRLMYYRDDLSQKGARNMYSVKISEDWFNQVSQQLDN
jgi:hypothetical protein